MNDQSTPNVLVLKTDALIERAGNGHTYQRRALYVFALQWLISSFFIMGYPFLYADPPLICYDSHNTTNRFSCNVTTACSGKYKYTFENGATNSLKKEFNLVCNANYWFDLGETSIFLGGALGAAYFAELSERKGRFYSFMQAIIGAALIGAVSVFSWSVVIFAICSFLIDFCLRGYMNNSLVYMSELSSANIRTLTPSLLSMCFAIGQILFAGLVYILAAWRFIMFLWFAVPLFITFLFYRTMNESPRYLVIMERYQEAKDAILNMARINNRPLPPFAIEDEVKKEIMAEKLAKITYGTAEPVAEKRNYSMLTLFKYKSMKKTTFALMYLNLTISVTYYALWYASAPLNGDLHADLLINGAIELFGYLVSAFLALNQRRKNSIKTFYVATGVAVLLLMFANGSGSKLVSPKNHFGIMIFIVAKACTCVATNQVLVYVLEFYPTRVRHYAVGFFSVITRFILVIVPSFIQTTKDLAISPLILVSALCIGGFFTLTYCPETYEKPLTDYIHEEESMLLNRELDEY